MKYNDMHMCGLTLSPGREAALAWGGKSPFFVNQDRKLKFGMHNFHAK